MKFPLMFFLLVSGISLSVGCNDANAEIWFPLDSVVRRCELIILAEADTSMSNVNPTFTVLESWKGKYRPGLILDSTPDGRFRAHQGEHGIHVVNNQRIVFFFSRHNNPPTGAFRHHGTAFPVTDGKVVYASTSLHLRESLTIEEFKRRILAITASERLSQPRALHNYMIMLGALALLPLSFMMRQRDATIHVLGTPCLARALILLLAFLCLLLVWGSPPPSTSLPAQIVGKLLLPQSLAFAAALDSAVDAEQSWITVTAAMILVFLTCLIEARLLLGLANATGGSRRFGWLGRRSQTRIHPS